MLVFLHKHPRPSPRPMWPWKGWFTDVQLSCPRPMLPQPVECCAGTFHSLVGLPQPRWAVFVFHQISGIFAIISFLVLIFLLSFCDSSDSDVRPLDVFPLVPEALFIFLHSFLSVLHLVISGAPSSSSLIFLFCHLNSDTELTQ